jgi:hypothetical protein
MSSTPRPDPADAAVPTDLDLAPCDASATEPAQAGTAARAGDPETPAYPDKPELALVALLEMLYRHRHTASPAVRQSIHAHLRVIADDARNPNAVRTVAARMALDPVSSAAVGAEPAPMRAVADGLAGEVGALPEALARTPTGRRIANRRERAETPVLLTPRRPTGSTTH